MRKVYAVLLLCFGIVCSMASRMIWESPPAAGRYTAAPASVTNSVEQMYYPTLWVDPSQGAFELSFGAQYSSMGEGTCVFADGVLTCREGERVHRFAAEGGSRLRYLGSEQPEGTPLEDYYAALQPAGADFAEQMLEGSVLRRLDGQTIRESWLQALDGSVLAV